MHLPLNSYASRDANVRAGNSTPAANWSPPVGALQYVGGRTRVFPRTHSSLSTGVLECAAGKLKFAAVAFHSPAPEFSPHRRPRLRAAPSCRAAGRLCRLAPSRRRRAARRAWQGSRRIWQCTYEEKSRCICWTTSPQWAKCCGE